MARQSIFNTFPARALWGGLTGLFFKKIRLYVRVQPYCF